MNTKSRNIFPLKSAKLVGTLGLGLAIASGAASADDGASAASLFWLNTAQNLNLSIDTSLYGFALSAIGLGGGGISPAIQNELNTINSDLVKIDDDIQNVDNDVKLENCNLNEADVASAVAHIRSVERDYSNYLTAGYTQEEIQDWVNEVFDPNGDGGNSISENLVTINTYLMPGGVKGTGVISSCLATLAQPIAQQLDDTTYYSTVGGLTDYYFEIQAEGMAMEAEAYNYKAYQAWLAANPNAQLAPNQAPSICVNATGDVLTNCKMANLAAQDVYQDLQDEFSLAGAPYSTAQYKILNGTNDLFVLSLEDFTTASGQDCSSPLTVTYQCGPTQTPASLVSVRTGFSTTVQGINQLITYGNYNQWKPVSASALTSLFAGWTNKDETLADYMTGLGFQNTANKVIYTSDTADVTVKPNPGHQNNWPSSDFGPGVCFADTRLSSSQASQPFCSNLNVLMSTTTYIHQSSESSCVAMGPASWAPSGASDDNFYQGLYNTGVVQGQGHCTSGWVGSVPGYLINYANTSNSTQLQWPYIDVSTLPCTPNVDGTMRVSLNPSSVPTMCGTDFDVWFQTIVAKPPALPPAMNGAPAPVSRHKIPKAITS